MTGLEADEAAATGSGGCAVLAVAGCFTLLALCAIAGAAALAIAVR